jgi:hypothetical protein
VSAFQQMLLAGGEPRDPYFDDVALLLHMDGANNSTTLVDSGPLNYSSSNWTWGSLPNLKTAQKKFGPSSLYFIPDVYTTDQNCVTSALDIPFTSTNEDFTLEFWSYCMGVAAYPNGDVRYLKMIIPQSGGTVISITATNDVNGLYVSPLVSLPGGVFILENLAQQFNQWTHIALTRQAGVCRLFVNGQLSGQATSNFSHALVGIRFSDRFGSANGYIDDFRFTVGVARYTSNFTVPDAPFPDQ